MVRERDSRQINCFLCPLGLPNVSLLFTTSSYVMGSTRRSSGQLSRKRVLSERVSTVNGAVAAARAAQLARLEEVAVASESEASDYSLDGEDEVVRPGRRKHACTG